MPGDYEVFVDGRKAGRVMRFKGNPASRRWVAYAVGEGDPAQRDYKPGPKRGFARLRDARAWLAEQPRTETGTQEPSHRGEEPQSLV